MCTRELRGFAYVEGPNDVGTMHGKRRVSARLGWVGKKSDFFSILLDLRAGTSLH
jgi:hypothetical protein